MGEDAAHWWSCKSEKTITDPHELHQTAYLAWREAEVGYWEMIDKLARGMVVADEERERVLSDFDATHKAWMRAGDAICAATCGPRRH